jgi:type II secretory pathway pseudopilin PulG
MKRLVTVLAFMAAAAVPLATYMSQRQQSRRSPLQRLAGAARDRATGAGESAWETLGSWGDTTLDALGDLAESARDRVGSFGESAQERAGSTAGEVGGLTGLAGTVLTGAPRIVAQIRSIDQDRHYYSGRDDWRKYGDVFPR